MLPLSLITSVLLAFLITLWVLPWLIRYLRKINLVVKDVHKEKTPLIPRSGGLAVLIGFMAGITSFMFFSTFLTKNPSWLPASSLPYVLAALLTVFIITFIGFIDDLLMLTSSDSVSGGLKQWQKPLLTLAAAIPLMVVNAGNSTLVVPFIGHVNFGLFYPLFLVPLAVVGAANMINLFAGFNGLEAGLGLIYFTSLGSYALFHERYVAALLAFVTLAALFAFYLFNKYPAKILPGDSLTYLLGAVLAAIAIVGNLEKAALILSIPFILEYLLKLRGKFKKQTIGYLKNGKIHSHYTKIYSLPHIFTRTGKYTEQQVVYFMYLFQLLFAVLIWVV